MKFLDFSTNYVRNYARRRKISTQTAEKIFSERQKKRPGEPERFEVRVD